MTTKYDKMTMAQLKSILKKNGIKFPEKDKDILADAVHQFDVAGMLDNTNNKNKGGLIKSRTGPQDFRKGGMVLSTVDNRKNK